MKTDAILCYLKNKNFNEILNRNRRINFVVKKNPGCLIFTFIISYQKKIYSTGPSAELPYIYGRSRAPIKNPKIIYFIKRFSAGNLTNTAPGYRIY